MISLPQVQFACDLCDRREEVEIEQTYVGSRDDFFFCADDWLAENGWARLDDQEIRCPAHALEAGNG